MAHLIAPEAGQDLDEIWDYVATESRRVDRADRLIDRLTRSFYLLSKYPDLGRSRSADLRPDLRSFPVTPYVIIYEVTPGNDVLILHVLHGRRDLGQILTS